MEVICESRACAEGSRSRRVRRKGLRAIWPWIGGRRTRLIDGRGQTEGRDWPAGTDWAPVTLTSETSTGCILLVSFRALRPLASAILRSLQFSFLRQQTKPSSTRGRPPPTSSTFVSCSPPPTPLSHRPGWSRNLRSPPPPVAVLGQPPAKQSSSLTDDVLPVHSVPRPPFSPPT